MDEVFCFAYGGKYEGDYVQLFFKTVPTSSQIVKAIKGRAVNDRLFSDFILNNKAKMDDLLSDFDGSKYQEVEIDRGGYFSMQRFKVHP